MPSVWLPASAAESMMAEKGQPEAERMVDFRLRLKALDSRLDLFLCDRDDPDNGLRMGFYYVYRRNDGGTVAFWEIQNPDGSFREPDERVIDAFRMMDRDSTDDLRDRHEARKKRAEKRAEDRRAVIEAQVQEQSDFLFRVQHAFPSLPWKKD